MSAKEADAASGAPAEATPDKRVDVTGVGGVLDGSNEQASKADGQVDVEGKGGTGVEDVSADKTETLPNSNGEDDAGFNKDKTTDDSGPTKTFDKGNSKVERQADPVGGGVFPSKGSSERVALDNSAYPDEDGGLSGGKANQGTQPVDPAGKADKRVNLLEPVTSPENNSGPTKTWNGTDGNGVTKQQPAVTNVPTQSGGVKSHVFAAVKLADTEVELGLTSPENKFNRIEELIELSPEELRAESRATDRVKTAGLGKKTAHRLPSFSKSAAQVEESEPVAVNETVLDSALFS